MSLFKKNILKQYNILGYEDNVLILHCSKNDFVKAPFDGKLDKDGTLSHGNKHLIIKNVKFSTFGKVKAGDVIGVPRIKHDMAYIGLAIYDKNGNNDIIKYLERKDVDEPKKKSKKSNADIEDFVKSSIKQEFVLEEDGKAYVELSVDMDEILDEVTK